MVVKPSISQVLLAHALGIFILLWPAWINGYPLLFSDTNAFIAQSLKGHFVWDKPFVYGPSLIALHLRTSLWLPLIVQAFLVVNACWLLMRSFGQISWSQLLMSFVVLSVISALPWFTSFLMPDIFAGITVIAIYILAFANSLSTGTRLWAGALAVFSIGSHLTHLPIALACLLVVVMFGVRKSIPVVMAIALAVGIWVVSNGLAFKQYAISPHGSVFMLARLSADGHVEPVLQARCGEQDWKLCSWKSRIPKDSDEFLWSPDGPVWTYPGGPMALSSEAKEVIREALLNDPIHVAISAIRNASDQMTKYRLGDTLSSIHLDGTVGKYLREYFPSEEHDRFKQSLQLQDQLIDYAASLNPLHLGAMLLGLVLSIYLIGIAWRRGQRGLCAFGLMVLLGLIANGVATGALSKPHDRYQARMAWLLVACPLWMSMALRRQGDEGHR